jgi:BirA family transcriptional regulator, biotin operon repressor / biotin---[acetyl-CoA-carboxylase] ligase
LKPQPQFIELDEVESTMAEAADRLAHGGIGPWTTIMARHQSRGRGRRNRQWDAEPGDALLATVVVPLVIPAERVGLTALATGLAVADAVSQWDVPVSLKWPNDIYIDDRKLGGILIQTRLGAAVTALIGIGINLASVPVDLLTSATCLADYLPRWPQPRELAEAIIRQLRGRVEHLESGQWQTIVDDWTARAIWRGEIVAVESRTPIEGTFIGVDEFGRMLVSNSKGVQAISEGDVQRGPRRSLYLDMK